LIKFESGTEGSATVDAPKPGGKRKISQTLKNRNSRKRTLIASAVEDQHSYFTPQEYSQLSQDQKKALHELRKKRSGGNGKGGATAAAVTTDMVQKQRVKQEISELDTLRQVTIRNIQAFRRTQKETIDSLGEFPSSYLPFPWTNQDSSHIPLGYPGNSLSLQTT
jgi:hypothetical protein